MDIVDALSVVLAKCLEAVPDLKERATAPALNRSEGAKFEKLIELAIERSINVHFAMWPDPRTSVLNKAGRGWHAAPGESFVDSLAEALKKRLSEG